MMILTGLKLCSLKEQLKSLAYQMSKCGLNGPFVKDIVESILMGECNTILSAYTKYRHLE